MVLRLIVPPVLFVAAVVDWRAAGQSPLLRLGVGIGVLGLALFLVGRTGALRLVPFLMRPWFFPLRMQRALIDLGVAKATGVEPRLRWRTIRRQEHTWTFAFRMPPGITATLIRRNREAIAQELDCSIQVWGERGLVYVRAGTFPLPDRVHLSEVRLDHSAGLPVTLGVSRMGWVRILLDAIPHLIVGGQTNGGKSTLIRGMLIQLQQVRTPDELRLVLIDLKMGMEFATFKGSPHLLGPVIRELGPAVDTLRALVVELQERGRMFEAADVKNIGDWNRKYPDDPLHYLLVVIDEFAQLAADQTSDPAQKPLRRQAENLVSEICRLGRAVGLHVVIGVQRPDVDTVPRQVLANVPGKVAFRTSNETNSEILLGKGNFAAANLPPEPGRGIFDWNDMAEFQGVLIEPDEARRAVEELIALYGGTPEEEAVETVPALHLVAPSRRRVLQIPVPAEAGETATGG